MRSASLPVVLAIVFLLAAATASHAQAFSAPAAAQPPSAPSAGISFEGNPGRADFAPWLSLFIAQVKKHWFIPYRDSFNVARVVVAFQVHRDGHITDVTIRTSSGIQSLDDASSRAVSGCDPALPLPAEYVPEYANFAVAFNYNRPDARPAAASAAQVESTKVIRFVPEVPAKEQDGYCWIGSLAVNRSDAWRCMAGNSIFDPCFAVAQTTVVCGDTPAKPSGSAFKLRLTKPLPKSDAQPEDPSSAFLVELADGNVCSFLTGATGAIDGARINFGCGTQDGEDIVIVGALRPGAVWMADRVALSRSTKFNPEGQPVTAKSRQAVQIRTVWR